MATYVTRNGRLDDGYNIDNALQRLLLRVSEIVRCDHASLVLRDPASGEMSIAAQWGMEIDPKLLAQLVTEERGIIYQVFNTGRPRIIGNTSRVAGYISIIRDADGHEGGHSRIAVPLFIDGEITGVLNLESRMVDSYSPADLRVLNPLMDIVALAVKAARQQRRLREEHYSLQEAYASLDERQHEAERKANELTEANAELTKQLAGIATLHQLAISINSTYQQEKMLEMMAETLVKDFGFDRSVILLSQGDMLTAQVSVEQDKETSKPNLRISIKDDAPRWAMFAVARRPIWCQREGNSIGTNLLQRLRLQNGVLIPLLMRGKLLGVAVAGNRQQGAAWRDSELQIFAVMSDYLVTAMEHIRLFQETQRRTAEQDILYRTVNDIANHRNLWQLLPVIIQRAVELLNAHSGAIYMHDRARNRLEIVSSYNMIPDQKGATLEIGEGLAGRVAENKRATRVPDYTKWPGHAAQFAPLQLGAVIGVPLLGKREELIGVLDVMMMRDERVFDESDERLLTLFANQASTVMETMRLHSDLQVANEKLITVSKMKSEFLANMSHELRTPLNAIIGYSDVLLQGVYGDLSDRQSGAVGKVQRNAKSLLGLINDVLDMSKIESGRFELNNQPFAPRELVEITMEMVMPQAQQKGLELISDLADDLPRQMIGDQQRLQQVLVNLIANAIKFTDAGSVTLKVRPIGSELWALTVIDTGIGLNESDYGTIFDEFRQVDNSSTRQYGGTGLGLAITRRLVAMMGGTVSVFSRGLGQGSTFTVTLPLVEPQTQRQGPEETAWREEARRTQVEWEQGRMMGDTLKLPSGDIHLQNAALADGDADRAEQLLHSEPTMTEPSLEATEESWEVAVQATLHTGQLELDSVLPAHNEKARLTGRTGPLEAEEQRAKEDKVASPQTVRTGPLEPAADEANSDAGGRPAAQTSVLEPVEDKRQLLQPPIRTAPLSAVRREGLGIELLQSDPLHELMRENWHISASAETPSGKEKSILVVDDDEQARDLISVLLRGEGHAVECASSLSEATTMINQTTPGMIILDLSLSPDSSTRFAVAMRAVERTRSVPIILVSADVSRLERTGAVKNFDYIVNKSGISSGELSDLVRVLSWQHMEASDGNGNSAD